MKPGAVAKPEPGIFLASCGSGKRCEKRSQISAQDDCALAAFAGLKAALSNCLIQLCSSDTRHGARFGYRQAFTGYRLNCFDHSVILRNRSGLHPRTMRENDVGLLF
jgi:hypothetical protein